MRDWLERFVDDGTIGESQLEEARSMAANLGITPEDALVRLGYINGSDLGRAQAEEFGYDYIELEGRQIPNSVIEMFHNPARSQGLPRRCGCCCTWWATCTSPCT